jgi:hypothetical protein
MVTETEKGLGDLLLFHKASLTVPSAASRLTAVFGMRTGVSRTASSPNPLYIISVFNLGETPRKLCRDITNRNKSVSN